MKLLQSKILVALAVLIVLVALVARDFRPSTEWVTISLPDPPAAQIIP